MINKIFSNVELGKDTIIDEPSIIGKPPRGHSNGELLLSIGENAHIRPFTTIYAGSKIGANFQTGQCVSIREENEIANNVSVGTNAVLEVGNKIGNFTRVHTGSFLELVTLGTYVFVGPNVVFTDDPHPMCPQYKRCKRGAIIHDYVKIGANSTILPGVIIGEHSLIGAGSVVTKDIPDYSVAVGNPARVIKKIDELTCPPGIFERPYLWPPYAKRNPEE